MNERDPAPPCPARRRAVAALAAVSAMVLLPGAATAQGMKQVKLLRELVDLIGAAGDALGKVADGFEKAVGAGVRTYDTVAARRTRSRLYDLRARLNMLAGVQNVLVFDSIPDYLDRPDPQTWRRVTEKLGDVSKRVAGLLNDLGEERSHFVTTESHAALVATLQARDNLISRLQAMPPPASAEELAELRHAQEKYGVLIRNLVRASGALAAYLNEPRAEETPPRG